MELIDREQALAALRQLVQLPNEMRAQAMAAVRRVKAVDAKKNEKHGRWLLDADKVRKAICRHMADVIYRGAGYVPGGKEYASSFEFLKGYEEGAKYIANLILQEEFLADVGMDLPNITENTRAALGRMGAAAHGEIDFDYAAEDD